MKVIAFLLASVALAAVYNIDLTTNARINPGGSSILEITSNPSTGYMWYYVPANSAKISVDDPRGVFIPPVTDLAGAPGKQRFTISCSLLCEEGDILEAVLALQRPWEQGPIDIRKVLVEVTNDQLD